MNLLYLCRTPLHQEKSTLFECRRSTLFAAFVHKYDVMHDVKLDIIQLELHIRQHVSWQPSETGNNREKKQ